MSHLPWQHRVAQAVAQVEYVGLLLHMRQHCVRPWLILFLIKMKCLDEWMNECMHAWAFVTSFPKHNFGFSPHKKTNPERFPLVATRGTQKKMFVLHGFTDLHGAQKPNVPGSAGSAVAKFPKRELQSCTVSLRNIQFRNHFLSALGSFTITRTHSALSGVLEFNSRGSVLEADSYF